MTGAGIVTGLGTGWKPNADGFRCGKPCAKPVSLFDVSRQRVRLACEAQLPERIPPTWLSARTKRRLNRASTLLLHATAEALAQAGWEANEDVAQVLGTTSCGTECGEEFYRRAVTDPLARKGQPTRVVYYQAQRQLLDVAEAFGLSGPITIVSNSCASSTDAIGHAWGLVRSGRISRVLTGGYDALSQFVFAGFDTLQALSPTTCRPFDAARDGLAIGRVPHAPWT